MVEQSYSKNRNSYPLLTFPPTFVIIGALKYTLLSINNSMLAQAIDFTANENIYQGCIRLAILKKKQIYKFVENKNVIM